ncbi:MAG: hypothetical protein DMF50_08335 [Acidobacteria bacterium]|nr:MAG: hypothetical protein DMF50_08335 [Acidobacteriota bacterium]
MFSDARRRFGALPPGPAAGAFLLAVSLAAPCGGARGGLMAQDALPPSRFPGGIPEGARGPDLAFYTIADRYLDESSRAYPTNATVLGYHAYDGLLEDFTPEGVRDKLDLARRYRAELAAVEPARLSASARIDYALVLNDVEGTLFTFAELRPHEWDPQSYVDLLGHATLYLTLQDASSPTWPQRLEALLSRMRRIPSFLAAARKNLHDPPRVITDLVLHTNAGTLDFFENAAPPLFARAPGIRKDLEREDRRVIAALREFQTWLEADLLPRSKGDWRLGKDLWTKKLRFTLQSSMTPEEILRQAQERLAADRRRMLEVATPLHAKLFPDHRHAETGEERINAVVGEVLGEVTRRHSTRESLFADARACVERAKVFIRKANVIGLPPDDDNFVVEPTPGFMDGIAVAFFNPPPVLEPDLKKSYWISSVPRGGSPERDREIEASFFREYNIYALQGLTIHEAFPGHYVQHWYALHSPMATIYKKVFASGTFAEGWAVLAEREMFDAGYAGAESENLLVHLKQKLRVPINAILDARLHTTILGEEEADRWALDLMQRLGFQEEAEARGKLRRAKVSSTQLSTYFVGSTELEELLNAARRQAGSAFDLRAFNERLLSFGTIPPRDVRQLMQDPQRPEAPKRPGPPNERPIDR